MFKLIITTLILLTPFTSSFAIDTGDMFPNIKIKPYLEKEKTFTPSMLQNKITLINFWATWCDACKIELKEMKKLFTPLLSNKKFQFLFVSLDKDPENASIWVKENLGTDKKFLSYLYIDPEFKAADKFNIESFPMTVIIDEKGKIIKIQNGFEEGKGLTKKLLEIIDKNLL